MSEDEVVALLSTADTRGVFLCRFTDGTEVEITDPWVRRADGKSECIATVVREAAGVDAGAGESLCVVGSDRRTQSFTQALGALPLSCLI